MKRRGFLRAVAAAGVSPIAGAAQPATPRADSQPETLPGSAPLVPVTYPRVFTGRQLSQIAFPLGGIGTGSIAHRHLLPWGFARRGRDRAGRTLAFSDDIVVAPGKDLTILL